MLTKEQIKDVNVTFLSCKDGIMTFAGIYDNVIFLLTGKLLGPLQTFSASMTAEKLINKGFKLQTPILSKVREHCIEKRLKQVQSVNLQSLIDCSDEEFVINILEMNNGACATLKYKKGKRYYFEGSYNFIETFKYSVSIHEKYFKHIEEFDLTVKELMSINSSVLTLL